MDEMALLTYLRRRGINSISEKEFSTKLLEYMSDKKHISPYSSEHQTIFDKMKKGSSSSLYAKKDQHFTESDARRIVTDMWHTSEGITHRGEKFSLMKAKEICEMYKSILPDHINYVDIYIAINAQYHDYEELFKYWFGSNIEDKIIESAIVFWFDDVDYKHESKVYKYFKD